MCFATSDLLLLLLCLPACYLQPLFNVATACGAGIAGNSPAARKFAKKASRVVYELTTCPTTSTAPFAVRFMFNYKLADFTPANCKKAVELNNQITAAQGE